MAKNVKKLAKLLGAEVLGQVPDTGGGAFGAERLGQVVATLQSRLRPSQGKRPGRPTDPTWDRAPKVPMSRRTAAKLTRLARRVSKTGRRVSPMQVAAQLLEDAVSRL
ncbi:MAG TPA: hypothetical protein VHC22_12825 [Pirellulales bacterium]|nr:hypothetical protein [Pirellulales bacterium]